jgi:hypothetical protein
VIARNYGAGILVRRQDGTATPTDNINNLISQNSIYANGTTGSPVSKQLGIDLLTASESANTGTSPYVTTNDANDADTGANNGQNFPVFESVIISGGNLLLKGCAPALATLELFEADVSPTAPVTVATGSNTNAPRTLDYGEGETYLTTLTEGTSDSDNGTDCTTLSPDGNDQTGMVRFSFSIPVPSGIVSGDKLTATATLSSNTSEFSAVATAEGAFVGLAKSLMSITPSSNAATNTDYLLEYLFVLQNFGNVQLNNLSIIDDLQTRFSGLNPRNIIAVDGAAQTITNVGSCVALTASTTYNSVTNTTLNTATANILAIGQSLVVGACATVSVRVLVTVDHLAATNNTLKDNFGTVSSVSAGGNTVTDTSTNGLDPDDNKNNIVEPSDTDNNPNESTATPAPFVKLVKEVRNCGSSLSSCTGTFGVSATGKPGEYLEYRIRYYNLSSQAITVLRVNDTLVSTTPFQEDTYSLLTPSGIGDFSLTCPNASVVDVDRTNAAVTTTPVSGAITGFSINLGAATACNVASITPAQQGHVLFKVRIP